MFAAVCVDVHAALNDVGQATDATRGQLEEAGLGEKVFVVFPLACIQAFRLDRAFNAQAGEPAALHHLDSHVASLSSGSSACR